MNHDLEKQQGPTSGQEYQKLSLLKMAEKLGFVENNQLLTIKHSFEYYKGFAENRQVYDTWCEAGVAMIDAVKDGDARKLAQFGMALATVALYIDLDAPGWKDELKDLIEAAQCLDLDDVADSLENLVKT